MRISISSPIPDLGSIPGPSRPGWPGGGGSYDFQFEVTAGQVGITVLPRVNGLRFTIKWQDGTEQAITSAQTNLQSPTTQAGIISINNEELDTTWCDDFAVASGKQFVTKVISWGRNPWNRLNNAFKDCTNLTDISTTSLIADTDANIVKMFNGCTSLLEADIKNWDLTAGVNWSSGSPFGGLANLQKLDMTGMNIKLTVRSDNAFTGIGTAVANGCEFLMSNINWSTSTSTYTPYWFSSTKLNPNSNLSGWIFPSAGWSGLGMFNSADMTGTNSTLNLSGWSTYSGSQLPQFNSFNDPAGDTGLKIDMSNMGMSNVTDMSSMFYYSDISEVIGLSTWGATAGNVNMTGMFNGCSHMKFSDSDNFTSTFINSLTPTNVSLAFYSNGAALTSGYGVAPNITNIDLSNCTNFHQFFSGIRCTNVPALNTATFPSTAIALSNLFTGSRFISSNETHLDFSNTTVKISNTANMFSSTWIDKVTFGNNVDFSALTNVTSMHYYMNYHNPEGTTAELTYPTNADFSSLVSTGNWFAGVQGPTTGPLTTCQIDNLIRRFRATAYNNALTVNFYQSQITEAPSVVRAQQDELVANGWTFYDNATDATIPFEYTGSLAPNTPITPTNNTGSAFTGTFTSSNSNIAVNSTTGVINSPNGGNTTIRYTLADGCYTEQDIELVSAAFSYSASAYCQDASDPTPTVTGTSGGAFSATIKVVPFQMQFEVSSGVEKTIEISVISAGNFTIDWGDNSTVLSNYTTGTILHTYNAGNDGTTVDPIISIGAHNDDTITDARHTTNSRSDLIDIPQWGSIEFGKTSFQDRFQFCNNLRFQISATDAPIIESPTHNMRKLFYSATYFNSDISHWNADAGAMLQQAFQYTIFNKPLNSWDVSRVTHFTETFAGSPFNQDLSGWDTSSATTFYYMFNGASSFNQNLSDWNISSLTTATRMFRGCTSLTDENYTDTVVGWAVFVYNNSGSPSSIQWTGTTPSFDGTRTSDLASGQTYAAKYGANWTATGWTDSQDAFDYLTTTLSWTIN